jgi:hypothetical protein
MPSFIPSVYPYEITLTLSTETPPSTLRLPHHTERHAPDVSHQIGSIHVPEPYPPTFSSKNVQIINSKGVYVSLFFENIIVITLPPAMMVKSVMAIKRTCVSEAVAN